MHIGILRTDSVRPEWVPTYGEYPDMFERLLLAEDDTLRFTSWNVEAGELPDSVDAADGFLITGSKSSVYDDKDWIRALEGFVRECHAARRKVIGICFGHQLVAQALGGSVGKSDKGWGVGVNCYSVNETAFDLADGDHFCLLASHQDQVMAMGDHILTFQGHPEFIPEYSREIMSLRHDMIGAERVAEGMASFESRQHEGDRVARWMLAFLSR